MEATLALHDAQGITQTTFRDVAARAGVAPATVIHHFGHMDDLIRACGELSDAMAPMPTELDLEPATDRTARVRRMVAALFTWYELLGPGWDHLQVDRLTLRRVDTWLREVADRHRRLVGAALATTAADDVELVTALTGRGVWQSLHEAGVPTSEAAVRIARLINNREGAH